MSDSSVRERGPAAKLINEAIGGIGESKGESAISGP